MRFRSAWESPLERVCSNRRSQPTQNQHRRISRMSSKRMLVVTMALLVSLIASFGSAADTKPKAKKTEASKAATEEKVPRLTIVQPVKDYGTVPKGEKLEWSFEIKNTGTADLQILAAKPGC